VVVDAVPDEVYEIMQVLKQNMEVTRIYGGCFGYEVALTIPVEFKLGLNWGNGKEFKCLPNENELMTWLDGLMSK
jgi:hypothetical protein